MSNIKQKKEDFSFEVVDKILKDKGALDALDKSLEGSMDFIAKALFSVPFVALAFGSAEELKISLKDTMMQFSKQVTSREEFTLGDFKLAKHKVEPSGAPDLFSGAASNKPKFMTTEASRFGYYFGTVDGRHIDSHNENSSFPGASMQKMMAGLLNMVLHKGTDKALTKKELEYLIGYQHHPTIKYGESSNVMMRALRNCKNPKFPGRGTAVGCLSPKENREFSRKFLDKIGISRNTSVGTVSNVGNKQTCKDVFEYLSLLWKTANGEETILKQMGHYDEAMAVFNTIRRKDYKYLGQERGIDRETYSMQKRFADKLRAQGINISSIYGKGGLYRGALNYGLIINEKYILVIYTKFHNLKTKQEGGYKALKQSRERIVQIGSYVLKKNSATKTGHLHTPSHSHGDTQSVVLNKNALNPYNSGKLVKGYDFHQKIKDSILFTTEKRRAKRQWAHPILWNALVRASSKVQATYGTQYKLYVGDLSNQHGGKMNNHKSHQMGIDADIGFYSRKVPAPTRFYGALVYNKNEGPTKVDARPQSVYGTINRSSTAYAMPKYFDLEMNALYLDELFKDPKVNKIFLDTPLVMAMREWINNNKPDDYSTLQDAIKQRRLKTGGLPGHHNHYHIRMHIPV